jgi:hypothetical protein
MVVAAAVVVLGLSALLTWSQITAIPGAPPQPPQYLIPAARDAGVYLVFASILFGIKRLVMGSLPRRH